MRLSGKVALITGAGSGIGRASALLFAREGARVVVVDINRETAEETVSLIRREGGTAVSFQADVSKASDAKAMVEFAEQVYGRLDVLFNNAGIFHPRDGSILETEEEVWDRVIAVNLKGVFLGCKYGIPALLRAGGGSIINMASFVALMGSAVSQIAYTASKGGVLALTREIAATSGPTHSAPGRWRRRCWPRFWRIPSAVNDDWCISLWAASLGRKRSLRPLSSWPAMSLPM
jgi:NAD(P)-dependent dehydrogenase (short-subunit alcohol dehydrogenase family)